jgi:hypothetical protein
MKPLYELVAQHRELERLADLEEIDRDTLLATLEGLEGEITVKAKSACAVVLNLEAWAEAAERAAEQMRIRSDRAWERAEWLRHYLLMNLKATGISKIETPEFRVSIRKNPARVVIDPEAKIPNTFMVQPPTPPPRPDKDALKHAMLNEQLVIDGVRLEQGERLEIR